MCAGIGRELAVKLYGLGAKVYAISRSPGPLEQLKAECPDILTASVDLGDWNATRSILRDFVHDTKIDGLVNNAGVGIGKPFAESTQ